MKRAVTQRCAKSKLSTTHYDVDAALAEYAFFDRDFVPDTEPDPKENDEYLFAAGERFAKKDAGSKKSSSTAPLPAAPLRPDFVLKFKPSQIRLDASQAPAIEEEPPSDDDEDTDYSSSSSEDNDDDNDNDSDYGMRKRAKKRPTKKQRPVTATPAMAIVRQFCSEDLRERVVELLERHYCAHPDIPGMARPDPDGIRAWAVKEMYTFCKRHDLKELWAYLWGNWYRSGRWNLWARSACEEIPRLKTNMICESQ
jgi:hypothetical protein